MAFPRALALVGALLASAAVSSAASDSLVIEAGRIVTLNGPDIIDGYIVVENGRIVSLGAKADVEKPWDAPVLGGSDFVAFPGFVEAHGNRGVDRPNENLEVAPFLDVRDSIDPVNFYFEDCLRWGVTTINIQQGNQCVIAARGRIVKPYGMMVEEMTVRPTYGMKIGVAPKQGKSRATQLQALRGAFSDLREHLEGLVDDKRTGSDTARREALYQGREFTAEDAEGRAMGGTAWKVEGLELVPRSEIDEKFEPLLHLMEGKYDAFLYCGSPIDVHRALDIARENGFLDRSTLVIDASCWKAADLIAASGRPVILDRELVHTERDPVTGDETETFVPVVLRDKGIRFALTSRDSSNNSLWYQAALATGLGLERGEALAAVTTVPAEILGLSDRVGHFAPGMDANVLLLSGDPLSVTSTVRHVVLEGEHVYDYDTDPRNRHLVEGIQPEGSAPGNPFFDGVEAHAKLHGDEELESAASDKHSEAKDTDSKDKE